MSFVQRNLKAIVVIVAVVAITSGAVFAVVVFNSNARINVTLLFNAGVMIEVEDTRIYIDPYDLPLRYSDRPADVILITHDHGDHYEPMSIDLLVTEDTQLFFPAIMSQEVSEYGAEAVQPGDTFTFDTFNMTCFYMYTMPGSDQSSHPKENNYTSYIIELEGMTMFHAGDSWEIVEYEQLTGTIDLAFLPLGPGCQTMTEMAVVRVIETIEPSYFIPIHYTEEAKEDFLDLYKESVEDCGCRLINLDYYESYGFN
ncbi:MAG: MBL fold metallo-hydrolase [Promethearchaeota archaeon]